MSECKEKKWKEEVETLGRTLRTEDGLFISWTCSGVRFLWEGTTLAVGLRAFASKEQELNTFTASFEERETWPRFALFLDDSETPYRYFLADRDDVYALYQAEKRERHVVTIRKITENAKGKICLTGIRTDGKISAAPKRKTALSMEFIGDSITCGFGNMVNDKNRLFYSEDEDGWMAYPAETARLLEADFSVVSCSGIAVTEGIGSFDFPLPPMKYYYPYTDRMAEELEGQKESPALWDFTEHTPDVVVLNLGTNDATVIDLNGEIAPGISKFEEDYYAFLKMLRRYNGRSPWIICSLGSMDYFLYDNIQRIVERFIREEKDERICCFKFNRIRINDALGACSHPHVSTQLRMGKELADFIRREILKK